MESLKDDEEVVIIQDAIAESARDDDLGEGYCHLDAVDNEVERV